MPIIYGENGLEIVYSIPNEIKDHIHVSLSAKRKNS